MNPFVHTTVTFYCAYCVCLKLQLDTLLNLSARKSQAPDKAKLFGIKLYFSCCIALLHSERPNSYNFDLSECSRAKVNETF